MENSSRIASWVEPLLRSTTLIAGLAAVLLFAYNFVLPLPRGWRTGQLLLLLGALGGLGLAHVLQVGRPVNWARPADGIALILGAASLIVGLGALILIPYGIALQITEEHIRVQTRFYHMADMWESVYLLMVAGSIAIPGGLGLWIARRGGRPVERASLRGVAVRSSTWGLGFAGLIVAAVAALQGYRWLLWG